LGLFMRRGHGKCYFGVESAEIAPGPADFQLNRLPSLALNEWDVKLTHRRLLIFSFKSRIES
jgi:hypothetical protein